MNCTYVVVKFDNSPYSREYWFKCYVEVKIGDLVVVDTKNGFRLATVVDGVDPAVIDRSIPTKDVVNVVDCSAFNARKEKAERLKNIKSKMEKRAKELQDIVLYEMLAENDPELKEMVNEFKALSEG